MEKIILTVPHSICLKGETREEKNCDLISLKFANILHDILVKNGYNASVIKSTYNRRYLDPNRFSTLSRLGYLTIKDSNLWKVLNEEIRDYKNYDNVIVFDVHSFPKGAFNTDKNIVILDNYPYQKIAIALYYFLKGKKYETTVMTAGIGSNAIIDVLTSGPVYIRALLIELNENLSDEDLLEIAKLFLSFLKFNRYVSNKKDYLHLKE